MNTNKHESDGKGEQKEAKQAKGDKVKRDGLEQHRQIVKGRRRWGRLNLNF